MAGYPQTARERFNFKHLSLDIFWWGVLSGSTIAFVSVYLARLGATSFQLALLAAGPAAINLFFSMPAGHWLRNKDLKKVTLYSSLIFRFGYVVLIFLPWIFTSKEQIWIIILVYLASAIPSTVLTIGFNAFFAELVSPQWRPKIVGRRNALLALSTVLTSLLVGYLLDTLPFPHNYQVIFGLGTFGALMSSYHIYRLKPGKKHIANTGKPINDRGTYETVRAGDVVKRSAGLRYFLRQGSGRLLRLDLIRGPFGLFLFAYLTFYIAQYLPTPLFPLYFVNELSLSDGILSIGGALFYVGVLLVSLSLGWFNKRLESKTLLTFGVLAYSSFPLLISTWGSAAGVLTAHAIGGLSWGFAGAGTLNHLMDEVPAEDRPAHMALHHITLNIGILSGSFLGPLLGGLLGIRTALIAAGLFRIAAGLLVGKQAAATAERLEKVTL